MMEDSVVTVRVATHDDVDKILYVSEGIYDGEDYLPIVLPKWLNDERKLIFLAEYDGEVIGLQVATIAENQQSFATQALRIHPKYRGKRLSYQLIDAAMASVRSKFPQIKKNRIVCHDDSVAFVMFRNKGFKPIMELKVHMIQKVPSDALKQRCAELCVSGEFIPLDPKDAFAVYKSEKLLNLIGPHSFIVTDYFPYKLPEDAHVFVKEAMLDKVVLDVTLQEFQDGKFPKSFSQGVLSKRVATEVWVCEIYTDDAERFKKHFLEQMNAAAQRIKSQEFNFVLSQSSGSKFDGCKLMRDELSRLELNCEVKSEVRVLMEYVLN